MGKNDDPGAVVDAKGRVYGVDGLRVVDSSAFPFTPPGHTQAMTYAVAEKLTEDVLNEEMKHAVARSSGQVDPIDRLQGFQITL
jgi:choline dehydrogenase-like flavoprotein